MFWLAARAASSSSCSSVPEHGIHGALDKEGIQDTKDASTGLPVISLYGDQRRPSLETLRGLDAVLIDIQDAGVRFYTYETVVRYFLEAAGQTGTDIVVLDRPDPLGGGFRARPCFRPRQRELRQRSADTGAPRHDVG